MGLHTVRCFACTLILALCIAAFATAQVSITTFHNDNFRSGQNVQETVLTPGNVNSDLFGKLYSTAVDGSVYAQPLYLPNVQIAGGTHNVLYVATEHDSLYAIDADSGAVLWQTSFINPADGITSVSSSDVSCSDMTEIGITSTPVIDPTTNTLFLVAKTKENGVFFQRLHAIDIVTNAEKFGGPVVIAATVNGSGEGGTGSSIAFDPLRELNRPGLLLVNGHVVIAWASHCDNHPYHGWVMSYSASTLAQEAVLNTSPNGNASGVWQSGDGLSADAAGNIYLATGNGTYDGPTSGDYGDSVMKLSGPSGGQFTIADWFTPTDQASLSSSDDDVSGGGVLLLPDLPAGSAHIQLLVQMGKGGELYLVDRNNMGQYCSGCTSDTQIVQEIPDASLGMLGSPSYWNGWVFWGAGARHQADYVRAFSFNAGGSGLLSTSPTSESTQQFSFSSDSPTISANGNSNGILWLLDNSSYGSSCCQILYAFDATNLANVFYSSTQAPNNRDQSGGAVKFTSPVVANGKVYAGGQASITAFGLLPPSLNISANPASITIPAQGKSGNTGISIMPVGGFTGTVNLTCSVVFAGTGSASNLPTCSFDSNQVNISGTASGSSMLEIFTTAPETDDSRPRRSAPFPARGVGILACACLLGAKGRRRWISACMLLVLVALIGCSISCGGDNESPAEQAGTTAGQYTVTVSAASGAVSASDPVTVVVQ